MSIKVIFFIGFVIILNMFMMTGLFALDNTASVSRDLREKTKLSGPYLLNNTDPSSQPSRQPSKRPSTQPSSSPTNPTNQPSSNPTNPSGQPTSVPSTKPSGQPSFAPTQPSNQPTSRPSSLPSKQPSSRPSMQPSTRPSDQPSSRPSSQPSKLPTTQPSVLPSGMPSRRPSSQPSIQPSVMPSSRPSSKPSVQPSHRPSNQPTSQPSSLPSMQPSLIPSTQPSARPSIQPSIVPSNQPSSQPSSRPSSQPSRQPSAVPSSQPSSNPTTQPSSKPSMQPSTIPTMQPSSLPTSQPSSSPTSQPTCQPSSRPSMQPSSLPTSQPSNQPSDHPSIQPSTQPSILPTYQPTTQPSAQPSDKPSTQPSSQPSEQPSSQPTNQPSSQPSMQPSMQPSATPTNQPSSQPSVMPSTQPSAQPSVVPTDQPSSLPSMQPSSQPTSLPTMQPSSIPTMQPSTQPSSIPTIQPSEQPSGKPTGQPSNLPTIQPSIQPSSLPTVQPSSIPTTQPTRQPSSKPSQQPSSQPSFRPSTQPSRQPSMVPSDQPSSNPTNPSTQPTSQPSIDLAKVVPIIDTTKTYTVVNTTSVTVHMTMTFASYYGGRIYCYASTNATTSPIRPVYVSSYYVDYVVGTLSTQVTIQGLVSLTSYYIYCGVRNFLQLTSTNSEISSAVIRTTTACCKSLIVTAAPAYVFDNGTLYLTGATSQSNIFTFLLDSLPSVQLLVTPKLYNEAGMNLTKGVEFRPKTLIFNSASTNRVGSFAMLIYNITGHFTIDLQLDGSSALEYYTSVIKVRGADAANVPTPSLSFAQFGDNGANIFFVFGSRTNYAQLSGVWSCSSLFQFAGANRTSCQWVNSTTVLGIFPTVNTGSLLTIGGNVTLLGNKIRASCVGIIGYCPQEKSATQSVLAVTPFHPITPSISIQTSNHVPSCENITIDPTATTGSAGRPWKNVTWTVSGANGFPVTLLKPSFDANSNVQTISLFRINTRGLKATTYYATLTVENHLNQVSSQSIFFVYGVNENTPLVNIQGPPSVSISADSPLKLISTVTQSICSSSSAQLEYQWEVTLDGATQPALNSSSKNPKIFSLSAYSLQVGNVYTVQLTVTGPDGQGSYISGYSKVTVRLVSGAIVAVINGGNKFLISSDTILDASSSYDTNNNLLSMTPSSSSSSSLSFLWSCTSLSLAFYGQSCDITVFSGLSTNQSTIALRPGYLNASTSYQIQVLVTNKDDGRFDTATATVMAAVSGYADLGMVSISSSSLETINEDQQLSILAVVSTNASLTATWTAMVDVTSIDLPTTLGPVFRNYTRPMNNIPFNLIIPGGTFLSGSTVTLRLALATNTDLVMISYAEITIQINTSPNGGSLHATPQNGTALETTFEFTTSSWVVDESALPLTYTYQYQLSANAPVLTIKVRSQSNILFSMLPPGSESQYYAVLVSVIAYDANLAKGYTQETSYVVPQTTSTNYSALLGSMLANPNTLSDPDQTLNILNVIGSTMNVVNCASAPLSYCAGLNRYGCVETPNTCGSCLANYTGVYGDANTPCVSSSVTTMATSSLAAVGRHHTATSATSGAMTQVVTLKAAGENCTMSTECIYGVCKNNTCIVPLQTCPTVDGMTCSGQGECMYRIDGNYVPASECTVTTTACIASCECYDGFGGIDCGLNSTVLAIRASTRISLCILLNTVLSTSDYSSELLESLAGTLLNSFSPYEVTSNEGYDICLNATMQLLALAESGYLDVTSSTTTTSLMSLISSFATKSSGFGIPSVDSSAASLVSSVMRAMITGQSGLQYSTSNLKVTVARAAVEDLADANITSPVSSQEAAYGKVGTQIMLVGNSSQYCDDGTGFASLSVGTWGSNPYAEESKRFGSNIMRFQSSSIGTIDYYNATKVPVVDNSTTIVICHNETVLSNNSSSVIVNCTTVSSTVNYTMSGNTTARHLSTIHALSKNATVTPAYYIRYPFTQTQTFDSSGELNYSIPECNSYNEYNEAVTCNSCNVSTYDNVSVTFVCYDITELCGGVAKTLPLPTTSRRSLQATTNDDAAQKLTIAQIGALLNDLKHEFSLLLSNPFRINLEKSKGILAFVGSLIVGFIVGIAYFYSWDRFDRSAIIYVERHKFANKIPDMNSPYKLKRGISSKALALYEKPVDDNLYHGMSRQASRRLERGLSSKQQSSSAASRANSRLVAQLLDAAIPLEKLDPTSENWFYRQFKALSEHHEYIYMIGGSSLIETRLIRWMNVTSNILVMLFLDTLFFGVFFPDSGTCEGYFTADLCTAPVNAATNSNLCIWTGTASQQVGQLCELNPPPQGVAFTMLLSTLSLLLLIPLTISFDVIRLKICSKRPDLEAIGLSSAYWLGLNYHELSYDEAAGGGATGVGDESQKAVLFSPRSQSLRKGMSMRQQSSQSSSAVSNNGFMETADRNHVVDSYFDSLVARTAFADSASTQTEVDFLIQDIRDFFCAGANQQPLTMMNRTYTVNRVQAKTIAIQKYLGLNIDGTFTSSRYSTFLSSFSSLSLSSSWLGSAGEQSESHQGQQQVRRRRIRQRRRHALEQQLLSIRQRAHQIEQKVLNAAIGGAMEPEISLLQHFILEQFPAYKRFTLRYHFFDFPNSNAASIHPVLWCLGWCYLIGAQLFFIYWIFAWAVSQGGKTFTGWGNNEILNIMQDIFLVQVMQVYLIYVSTIASIVPQLRSIYVRLYEVANKMDTLTASGVLDELRVVQYLSPACRAARKSPAVSKLRAAKILRCLDDIDVQYCRQLDRKSFGFWAILAIAIPGLLSYFGQSLGDLVLKAIFPTSISAVVLIYWSLYNVSIILCFVLVLALIIVILVYSRKSISGSRLLLLLLTCCQSKQQQQEQAKKRKRLQRAQSKSSAQYKRIAGDVHAVQLKKRWQQRLQDVYLAFISRWQAKETRITKLWQLMNLPDVTRIDHRIRDGEHLNGDQQQSVSFVSIKFNLSPLQVNASSSAQQGTPSDEQHHEFRSVLMNLIADELHAADRRFAAIKMKNTYEQLPAQIKREQHSSDSAAWQSLLWDEQDHHTAQQHSMKHDLSTILAVKCGLLPAAETDYHKLLEQQHLTDTTDGGGFVLNKEKSSSPRHNAFLLSMSEKEERLRQEHEQEGNMELTARNIKHFEEAPPLEFNALFPSSPQQTSSPSLLPLSSQQPLSILKERSLRIDGAATANEGSETQPLSTGRTVKSIRFDLPPVSEEDINVQPITGVAALLANESDDPALIVSRHAIEAMDEKEGEKVIESDDEAEDDESHSHVAATISSSSLSSKLGSFCYLSQPTANILSIASSEESNLDDQHASIAISRSEEEEEGVAATVSEVRAVDFFASMDSHEEDGNEE